MLGYHQFTYLIIHFFLLVDFYKRTIRPTSAQILYLCLQSAICNPVHQTINDLVRNAFKVLFYEK